jgi:osmoprotectant transport system permease protein
MNVLEYVADRWDRLSLQAFLHVSAVVQCTVLAAVLGVAIGVAVYRSPAGSALATALASTILTIPSFALLALLIPVFGLGADTTVVALVLYALLPIVRNTITGLEGVDPAVVESALGVGMGRWQRLVSIELPLAWPVVVTGMRVSAVLLVGIAALGPIVGGPGLGELIFAGLRVITSPNAVNLALMGTLGVVVVGLLLDGGFLLLNRLTTSRGLRR